MNSAPGCMVFSWGPASHSVDDRHYFESFSLNGEVYRPGDAVCLFNENESLPPYLGRITACFSSTLPHDAHDPHSIEIRWFERVTNLEPGLKGVPGREQELVELEETDVNPIGCISGKCHVFISGDFNHASTLAQAAGVADSEWFFCRGVFRQATSMFQLYPELEDPRAFCQQPPVSGPEDVADSDEYAKPSHSKRQRLDTPSRLNNLSAMDCTDAAEHTTQRRKSSSHHAGAHGNNGRYCVECGATHTPQWREGPQGPKTLCNACGVRFNRALQKAARRGAALPTRPPSPCARGRGSSKAKGVPAEPAQPTTRPMRQAAMMAATRTAEFARTGVFPVADLPALSNCKLAGQVAGKHPLSDGEAAGIKQEPQCLQQQSRDSSHNSTDFADHHHQLSLQQGLGAAAMAAEGGAFGSQLGHGEVIGPERCITPVDISSLAQRAATFVPGISEYSSVLSQWDQLKDRLPAGAVQALIAVGAEMEQAANDAAAADAALDAVRQVLVARKEAADQARDSALAAATRMRTYMSQLASQYPLLDPCSHLSHQPDPLSFPGMMDEGDLGIDGITLLQGPGCQSDLCGDEDLTLALGPLDHGLIGVQE
mmetsp:Transcript_15372/g.38274  ORF Transcript_15372/g.38274 Transcript_15372/m.38274 type:complete len:599 (-) Transcript_15372:1288-3084(-)|eukprot:CAMPEP_0202868648 /NCGR_PEP_ID=MMETSP1391-20130828/10990_1 /ASSEMBLY_ACC=CAM_ASM_000867 /TAXON_ID=1034604 /ORGANISM="Chlamydomonas leiostraca, Strain SAG 11-49" /LENGTH=598 /DNA_ID=CAMNT_0049548835 /DNA_START=64 /DNA_END=1860 /DNA_ORIENTATION=-